MNQLALPLDLDPMPTDCFPPFFEMSDEQVGAQFLLATGTDEDVARAIEEAGLTKGSSCAKE